MPHALYVVRRIAPVDTTRDTIPDPRDQYRAAFGTQAEAEEHARHLDREYKRAVAPVEPNPFRERPLNELTSLPEFALRDWLTDAGIDPPDETPLAALSPREMKRNGRDVRWRMWINWWDESMASGALTPEQRAKVWEALTLHRFHEVVDAPTAGPNKSAPVPETVYALVRQRWEYDDCFYCGANDALRVYRTREQAEAELHRLQPGRPTECPNGGPDELVVVALRHRPTED